MPTLPRVGFRDTQDDAEKHRTSADDTRLPQTGKNLGTAMLSGFTDYFGLSVGGQYWDRTSDPRRVKAVLYR